MARKRSAGFELNSVTAGHDFDSVFGSPTIDNVSPRSGLYAGKILNAVSGTPKGWELKVLSVDNTGDYYARVYLKIHTPPNANTTIISLLNVATNQPVNIMLTTAGALRLKYNEVTTIGSDSSVLTLDQWYRVELRFNKTGGAGASIVSARIDGVDFASATNLTVTNSFAGMYVGVNLEGDAATTLEIYFDDIGINDTSGTSQTSYPGDGKLIALKTNGAGEVNTFATQVGGTAGSANNYTRLSEVTPDDATSYNGSSTLNQEDLFDFDDSGIGASDTVNVVEVHGRFRNSTADATAKITFEIEKANAGTKSSSAAIAPNSTVWSTNSVAVPRNPVITLYKDPDGVNAWTQATLDTLRAGYKLTTGPGTAGRRIDVTKLWVYVDYTPATGTNYTSTLNDTLTGVDSLIKSPEKRLSDAKAMAESILKDITRLFSDTDATSESFVKVKGQYVSLNDSSAGQEVIVKSPQKVFVEAEIISESVQKAGQRTVNDTSTGAEVLIKAPQRSLSDARPITDSIVRQPQKVLADNSTGAESLVKSSTRLLSDSSSMVDTILKAVNRAWSESITFVENFVKTFTAGGTAYTMTLTDATAMAESFIKAITRTLTIDAFTGQDTIKKDSTRTLADAKSFSENLLKSISRLFTDGNGGGLVTVDSYDITNRDLYEAVSGGDWRGIAQAFTGDGSLLDSVKVSARRIGSPTGNVFAKLYSHTGTFGSGSVGTLLATSIAMDVSTVPSGPFFSNITFQFDDTYTLVNGTHYFIAIEFTGGDASNDIDVGTDLSSPTASGNEQLKNSGGSWNNSFGEAMTFFVYGKSGTGGIVDTLQKSTSKAWIESLSMVESFIKTFTGGTHDYVLALTDSFTSSEVFSRAFTLLRSLTDSFTGSDSIVKSPAKSLADSRTITDSISRQVGKNVSDSSTIAEILSKVATLLRSFSDSFTGNDTMTKAATKPVSDSKTFTDSIARQQARSMAEVFTADEIFSKSAGIFRTLTDNFTSVDTISKAPMKLLTDSKTMVDTVSRNMTHTFNDSVTEVELFFKRENRQLADSFTGVDIYSQTTAKIVDLFDNSAIGEIYTKLITKQFSDSKSFVDSFQKATTYLRNLADTLVLAESITKSKQAVRSFMETITTTDTIQKFSTKNFAEDLIIIETFAERVFLSHWRRIGKAVATWTGTGKATASWNKVAKTIDSWTKQSKPE